jgi:hypothetical protein
LQKYLLSRPLFKDFSKSDIDISQFFVGIAVYSKKLLVEIPHLGAWIELFQQPEGSLGFFNKIRIDSHN